MTSGDVSDVRRYVASLPVEVLASIVTDVVCCMRDNRLLDNVSGWEADEEWVRPRNYGTLKDVPDVQSPHWASLDLVREHYGLERGAVALVEFGPELIDKGHND